MRFEIDLFNSESYLLTNQLYFSLSFFYLFCTESSAAGSAAARRRRLAMFECRFVNRCCTTLSRIALWKRLLRLQRRQRRRRFRVRRLPHGQLHCSIDLCFARWRWFETCQCQRCFYKCMVIIILLYCFVIIILRNWLTPVVTFDDCSFRPTNNFSALGYMIVRFKASNFGLLLLFFLLD